MGERFRNEGRYELEREGEMGEREPEMEEDMS